jgi:hypothetical protein
MVPFSSTSDNVKYDFAVLNDYTFKIERTSMPFTQIRVHIWKGTSDIGRAWFDSAMDNRSRPIETRWATFMTLLQNVLSKIVLDAEVPMDEVEVIWNRIIKLIFTIKDNKIIVTEPK